MNAVLADAWVYTVLKEKERQTPWCLHLVLIGREWVHEGYYLVDKKKEVLIIASNCSIIVIFYLLFKCKWGLISKHINLLNRF